MKLVRMSCPHCGGTLQVSADSKQAECPYCDSVVVVDDEAQHTQFNNTEMAGYEFERGRIRARQDTINDQIAIEKARIQAQREVDRKRKNLIWWILGWIFIFPVPITVLIVRSKELNTVWKVILIAALWGAIWLIGLVSGDNTATAGMVASYVTA